MFFEKTYPQFCRKMSLLKLLESVFILTLVLASVVDCQRIKFDERGKCSADSTCRAIRRCHAYRKLSNIKNVGVTCGPGQNEFRKVCCPKRNGTPRRGNYIPASLSRPAVPNSPAYVAKPKPASSSGPVSLPRPVPPLKPLTQRKKNRKGLKIVADNSGCGWSSIPSTTRMRYIIGGQNSTQGQWPWMVAITSFYFGNYRPHCSGFLVDERHVISAAHCFDDKNVNMYQARIGNIDRTIAERFWIDRIEIPDGYRDGKFYNDIAILTLNKNVSPDLATPICLPDAEIMAMKLTNTGTSVAGWGKVSLDKNSSASITLNHLDNMPVWSNEDCNRAHYRGNSFTFRRQFSRGIDKTFICAGFREGGKDACTGDSGGPLMKMKNERWYVVGVVSFGNSCGRPNIPGGYTKVTAFMEWINNTLKIK